jgi:pyruvate ferredoxin oxidoreductase beta subunit
MAFKALDSNVIVINATGCAEIFSGQFPNTAWQLPWMHTLFENTAAVASGVDAALKAMGRKGYDIPENTKVVAMGGDGGTAATSASRRFPAPWNAARTLPISASITKRT